MKETLFTQSLDIELKINVALGLVASGCVVRDVSTCFLCALELAKVFPRSLVPRIITYNIAKTDLVFQRH